MIKLLCCFLLHFVCWNIIDGECPGIDKKSVAWWIIYQQKQKPFVHYYIDNTNINQITPHFPEKEDSVLSRAISPLINDENTEYIVYTSDLINAANIAKQNNIPMYSKVMHGIIATKTSWNSGFWILHNNLFFPPIENRKWKLPGSKQWVLATMGDSMSDIFYICLSAETKNQMSLKLKQMLAGNPIIILRNFYENPISDLNLQAVGELKASFWLNWSASFFMNCMYAAESEIKTQCLFNYSMNIGTEVLLYTRPRGMIRQGMSFCYNGQSKSSYEWVGVRATTTNNQDWRNSMFALTDQSESNLSDLTCFGQDIGANTETVAIMRFLLKQRRIYRHAHRKTDKSTLTRRKRDVGEHFVWRHLWPVPERATFDKFKSDNIWITKVVCSRLVRLVKTEKIKKNRVYNTFIAFNDKLVDFKLRLQNKINPNPNLSNYTEKKVNLAELGNIMFIHLKMSYFYNTLKKTHRIIIDSISKGNKGVFDVGIHNGAIKHLENMVIDNEQRVFPFGTSTPPSGKCRNIKDRIKIENQLKETSKMYKEINNINNIEQVCSDEISRH
ncbi:hypothetical protein KUTeg_019206 [Tegillarca granosa]|uniref:Uncharacterized protein n=1 Tax=Tegillarca granosa TaxID=220873 RepID=A0ABQ9ECB0_TEGGR|nr:hypothetical protein KUTeg_019206 [Tegillarca granosa]